MSHEQLDNQLIDAALEGNLDKVCNLLAAGANPNTLTIKFTAPLFIAADIGDAEMIRVMVKAGAKVNMRIDSYQDVRAFRSGKRFIFTINQAPLHVAICKGRTDAVNALLKLGANVFTTCGSKKNKVALYLAVEIVQLNVAIREGRTDAVNTLSKLRADEAVQCKKKREDTARDIAKVMIRQALSTYYHETKITLEDGQSVRFNPQITPSWIKDSELSKYWGKCLEMEKMQNDEIGNSDVSFYQFLSETNPIKLAGYLSDEYTGVQQELERGQYAVKYPLCASMIKSQYDKGMETRELLSRSVGVVKCYLEEGAKKEDIKLERVCPRRLEEMLAETARSILTDADVKRLMKSKEQRTA